VVGVPTPFSPGIKLSLGNTLVIVNTEFNRTANKVRFGRNHAETNGHVALLMGGPVNGGEIAGHIGLNLNDDDDPLEKLNTAKPEGYSTQADIHAAVLDAVGIDVWAGENFRQSDGFGPVTKPVANTSEDDIRDNLRSHVLGES